MAQRSTCRICGEPSDGNEFCDDHRTRTCEACQKVYEQPAPFCRCGGVCPPCCQADTNNDFHRKIKGELPLVRG